MVSRIYSYRSPTVANRSKRIGADYGGDRARQLKAIFIRLRPMAARRPAVLILGRILGAPFVGQPLPLVPMTGLAPEPVELGAVVSLGQGRRRWGGRPGGLRWGWAWVRRRSGLRWSDRPLAPSVTSAVAPPPAETRRTRAMNIPQPIMLPVRVNFFIRCTQGPFRTKRGCAPLTPPAPENIIIAAPLLFAAQLGIQNVAQRIADQVPG